FPLGGVGVSGAIKEVMDSVSPDLRWMHGYTCSAHPVGCAVAIANIRILEEERLVERSAVLGRRLQEKLGTLDDHPHVGQVRGLGLLAGIELVADKATGERYPAGSGIGRRVRDALFARGLLTRVTDETVCLAPPLVVGEDDVDRIARIVSEAIIEVTGR
ncbi:MAG TPA: aminotransferase class III-fold pyridoxal phosphate-dependent enzyme, partial [Chlorobaculum sp.]|nr:aminotransferase class III-fold pyridoxal phosphate-dependent enzyme [Chlorobaculum sp.]